MECCSQHAKRRSLVISMLKEQTVCESVSACIIHKWNSEIYKKAWCEICYIELGRGGTLSHTVEKMSGTVRDIEFMPCFRRLFVRSERAKTSGVTACGILIHATPYHICTLQPNLKLSLRRKTLIENCANLVISHACFVVQTGQLPRRWKSKISLSLFSKFPTKKP